MTSTEPHSTRYVRSANCAALESKSPDRSGAANGKNDAEGKCRCPCDVEETPPARVPNAFHGSLDRALARKRRVLELGIARQPHVSLAAAHGTHENTVTMVAVCA